MNYKILIAICLLTIIINVTIHSTIINQDKEIRQQAYQMVNEKCACNPNAQQEFKLNFNFTQWNETTK